MTCKCLPSYKRVAQICSNHPDTGNCPGKNETREEAAQSKGKKSDAKEQGADVVGGGEMEPVPHRIHLVSIAVSTFEKLRNTYGHRVHLFLLEREGHLEIPIRGKMRYLQVVSRITQTI